MSNDRRQTKVLIVEDDPDLRELLRLDFELAGYQATAAPSGKTALAALLATPAHVVVSDIRMPDGDGITLLKEVKARGIPSIVYLITGYADVSDRELLSMGCRGVFQKPFDIDALMTTIDRDLAASRAA
jgi:DNA-binding NtrC family response regulator